MEQPLGFEKQGNQNLVCKLSKALYGLKQASRAWFNKLKTVLLAIGFRSSRADTSLFYRYQNQTHIMLLIYVDDILITGDSEEEIQTIIEDLSKIFSLKDLGEVHHFLGIEITCTTNGLHLCQSKYIRDLLDKAHMSGAKGTGKPMVSSSKLSKGQGSPTIDGSLYRSVVGALQYITITRPDITFSVNKVSQFMQSPLDTHWKAVKRILRYLAGTSKHGLHLTKSDHLNLVGFSDSDWASDPDDRRSISGFCVYLGNNLVYWCSKKQHSVSRSSTEAEYQSLAQVTAEILWLTSLLHELGISTSTPIVWIDNLSAVSLAANPVLHARTKHIELDFHFVREKVADNKVQVRHVPSIDQVADVLTKPLSLQSFTRFRDRFNVQPLTSLELRGRVNHT